MDIRRILLLLVPKKEEDMEILHDLLTLLLIEIRIVIHTEILVENLHVNLQKVIENLLIEIQIVIDIMNLHRVIAIDMNHRHVIIENKTTIIK